MTQESPHSPEFGIPAFWRTHLRHYLAFAMTKSTNSWH